MNSDRILIKKNTIAFIIINSFLIYLLWGHLLSSEKLKYRLFSLTGDVLLTIGLISYGSWCFSQDKQKRLQGWAWLAVFAFMIIAKVFLINTLEFLANK